MGRDALRPGIPVPVALAMLLASCLGREVADVAGERPAPPLSETTRFEAVAVKEDVFAAAEWPVAQGNACRTGRTMDHGPGAAYQLAWKADLGDHSSLGAVTSPVFGGGRIYTTFKRQGAFAIRPRTGEIVWRYPLGTYSSSSPGYRDGVVYVAASRPDVTALDAKTGAVLWSIRIKNPHPPGPHVWPGGFGPHIAGSLVFHGELMVFGGYYGQSGKSPGFVCAVNVRTRRVAWKTRMAGMVINGCATDGERVYVCCADGSFNCLDVSDGRMIWKDHGFGHNMSMPVLIGDTVCFGTYNKTLQCRRAADGAALWSRSLANSFNSGFATDGERLFMGGEPRLGISAVDLATGRTVWLQNTDPAWARSSPILAGPYLYIGDTDGKLRCIDAATGQLLWGFRTGGPLETSPLVIGRWVFVQSADGYMYALRPLGSVQPLRSTDAAIR